MAQCSELCWQLRGEAEKRQVPGAKLALQHNIGTFMFIIIFGYWLLFVMMNFEPFEFLSIIGLGGAVVVALYQLGFPAAKSKVNDKKKNETSGLHPSGEGFQVTPYLRVLEIAMQEDKDKLIEKVRGIYGFRVTHGPNGAIGYWVINAKVGKGSVTYNGKDKPDVTFVMKDPDVVELISGKLQPQKAFFQGKVKVHGNMGLAMKLIDLQKTAQSRIEELRAKL